MCLSGLCTKEDVKESASSIALPPPPSAFPTNMIEANNSTDVGIVGSVLSDSFLGVGLLRLIQSERWLWHREQVKVICGC